MNSEGSKKKALTRVSDELANQPKQPGEATEESKEKRAVAEENITKPDKS